MPLHEGDKCVTFAERSGCGVARLISLMTCSCSGEECEEEDALGGELF